jgi:hypothetical protein
VQRCGSLLLCLATWLGAHPSLRAEYAAVSAPATEPATDSLLRASTGDAVESSLRFLSPIYLEQYYRATPCDSEPAPLPIDLAKEATTESGMGQPAASDLPVNAPAATVAGDCRPIADATFSQFLQCRERIVVCQPARSLFRPPRA